MLGIIIDTVLLIVLIQAFDESELNWIVAGALAIVASLISFGAMAGLMVATGSFWVSVIGGGLVSGIVIGIAVSALIGMDLKRAFYLGITFFACKVAVSIGLSALWS